MTAAYRLKGLGWFGSCVVVALGFYLVSLQVASERKRLEQVDTRIRVAERDIRALETEFDTRANLAQLERWNGDTLALVAPGASQFVRDEAQLAAIRFDVAPQVGGAGEVRTAALVVPAFSAPAAAGITAPTVTTPAPAGPVTVKVAAVTRGHASAPVASATARATPAVATAARPIRTQTVAMLLSDSTLGDLVRSARSEARTLR